MSKVLAKLNIPVSDGVYATEGLFITTEAAIKAAQDERKTVTLPDSGALRRAANVQLNPKTLEVVTTNSVVIAGLEAIADARGTICGANPMPESDEDEVEDLEDGDGEEVETDAETDDAEEVDE